MSIQQRKVRDRAAREQLIVTAARELAESEGWDAVTTRRLAERIEYSQPVLYSHFAGKDAIVAAVALEGFAELAETLNAASAAMADPGEALSALLYAYSAFGERNPALYDAMFTMGTDLPFGKEDTPAQMKAGFDAIKDAVAPLAGGYDPATLAELAWSALHGLVTLSRGGRLPPEAATERMAVLGHLLGAHR